VKISESSVTTSIDFIWSDLLCLPWLRLAQADPTPLNRETPVAAPFSVHQSPNANAKAPRTLFLYFIELLAQDLVHGEHVYPVLLENCMHSLIASDLALVLRHLQVPLFDIFPDFFNDLWSWELVSDS
jgi:hypothetical protein